MGQIAIRLEDLSKQYRIGTREPYRTVRETVTTALTSPFRRLAGLRQSAEVIATETIWALKDVSCEISHGEVVGIIGRNGAGKSTLLKIMSRITEPTRGVITMYGRVGSLLEVGTGFHPELTGRENIYLNGAILGMKRTEIKRRFDEIVAFAEVDQFIDTPVKRYSTGMSMRLAFAVAAHLEPEILLVDEVLAVGDARFQRKCLDKMQDVGQEGRTVLFVSHSMSTIARLCERVILLDGGTIVEDGPAPHVVASYMTGEQGTAAVREWSDPATAPGADVARLRAVRVRTEDNQIPNAVDIRQPVGIEMEYEVLRGGQILSPFMTFYTGEGVAAFTTADLDPAWRHRARPEGCYVSTARVPGNFLAEGTLFVRVGAFTMNPHVRQFDERDVVAFQVVDSLDGDSVRGDWGGWWRGVVRPLLEWTTKFTPAPSR
jgi:lipopolysaccharide transport system ATP-binding protein